MRTAEIEMGAVIDGRYRVLRQIGIGGMSRVFLARDEALGREVALKVFPSAMADDTDHARRRDEVTLLAGLSHPGLVVLFDAGLESDPPYLTMEHVVGESLAERLHRGPLPADEAETLVLAVAEALAFVHARGVVHRDVKPGNILLPESTSGTGSPAKLADFGIARLIDGSRVTATGSVMGTAAFISPEQASGSQATPASDVYSLGIVMIESLTGRHPFPGTALESAAARTTRPPDLADPALSLYQALLDRMTALDPADRPTAEEVVAELRGDAPTRAMTPVDAATVPMAATTASATATTAVVTPASAVTPPVRPRTRTPSPPVGGRAGRVPRWLAVAAAVVLAVAVIVAIALATRPDPGPGPGADPGAGSDPGVTYPAVSGELGNALEDLQDAVAGTGLEGSVLAATSAAADKDYETASRLLDAVSSLAAQALAAGEIDADQAGAITAAVTTAQDAIQRLLEPTEETDTPGNSGNGNGNGNGNGKKD